MNKPTEVNIAERRKNRTLLIVEVYRAANGGRARQIPLWDIAQGLGIKEDEASDIYAYYQDKGFFRKRVDKLVRLSYLGILEIEDSILKSQAPLDLLLIIQKRRELRFTLLKKLFEKTGGSSQETVNFKHIATEEGISEDDISDFLYYLSDEDLIKAKTVGYRVSITINGIEKVEEWMGTQANDEQANQLDQQSGSFHSDYVAPVQKLKVFLCHSSKNKPAVRELYNRLSADGIEAWLDEKNILPGQNWELEIKKAVRNSDAIIVCLSKDAMNNRGYVHKEIKLVLDEADRQPEGHIFIIPILLEECEIPERLSHLHYLRYYDNPDAYGMLLRSLKARAEQVERPGTLVCSTQIVVESAQQNELSQEQAVEAGTKISEWLKAREIWKNEWIDFKDIAEATGIETWVVKECIDYAAILACLKIQTRLPNSVLLVTTFGSSS